MSFITKIKAWTSSHNPKWLAFIRVVLGLCLLIRGVEFLDKPEDFHKLITSSTSIINQPWISGVIPWIHIVGGFLIIIGFATRFACLVQMPVILGAIIFVHPAVGSEFEFSASPSFSILIFLLLILFFLEGSGPVSIANYFKEDE